MLFSSLTFVVFLAVVTALFWVVPTWNARKWLLLAGSYLFYAAWNPPYTALLAFSTSFDWWIARQLGRSSDALHRKQWLVASLAVNLTLLGVFKYGGFLVRIIDGAIAGLGIPAHLPQPEILLPIGISFYTFASLSYTIDVYRRNIHPDCSFRDYALFVSFFPHLIAGPIVRAAVLLPQIETPRLPSLDQVAWGFSLFVFGIFSKTVLADSICAPIVDDVFAAPDHFGSVDSWAAIIAFSGQIYFDFSGYSLCAIGLAMTFGFAFPENFRAPYAAISFGDFWRRWHISLSSWLRDYLYISLGGNRAGPWRTYRNLIVTMWLGGLWHGASWLFVLWGACHGAYLVLERAWSRFGSDSVAAVRSPSFFRALLIFMAVTLTWIPFRATDLNNALAVASHLAPMHRSNVFEFDEIALPLLLMTATLWWQWRTRSSSLKEIWSNGNPLQRLTFLTGCLIAIYLCSGGTGRAFIYFQF